MDPNGIGGLQASYKVIGKPAVHVKKVLVRGEGELHVRWEIIEKRPYHRIPEAFCKGLLVFRRQEDRMPAKVFGRSNLTWRAPSMGRHLAMLAQPVSRKDNCAKVPILRRKARIEVSTSLFDDEAAVSASACSPDCIGSAEVTIISLLSTSGSKDRH